jgi:hypothetical protein
MLWGGGRERDGASIRVLSEPRPNQKCYGARKMRPFAIWVQTTRSGDAEGRLPGSPSPRGLSDGAGAPMPRLRGPPRGHPTLAGKKKKCPFCPYFSTPPWDWGPPNSVVRSYTHFYTSRSALRHSRSWSLFRHFGRENLAVCQNRVRYCSPLPRRPPDKIK